ncbi:uncharacterized protein PITG_01840 [Phytophthora infestans T30-4]|uniref:Uncharacterized protein n=1 Tax=Phytophthora infestans (strain T30-4) TaxID=403677 RepID=D0MU79_PHYIT|nr:uncharacterized protein PITG_01840 [Phytophthora infestans T30-4]EEY61526.1 conserved hypothetical protein [Phytophthora infestans T30-4]|eukprot:XP_002908443.1 conserved hypothetical protein [Phytophthora infestans T30-4]
MSLTSAPLEVGLAFDTGPESAHAVQDYALARHKSVRVERASGSDRRLVCSSEVPCGFFVQIYRKRMADKKTYGKWYIASLDLTHSEGCNSKCRLTTRQVAALPAFVEAVRANPKASIELLMDLMLERHGVSLQKQLRLVYRARDLIRNGKKVNSNLLPSEDAPLPERQYVRCRATEKKPSPEPERPKSAGRMTWSDALVESLLIERLVKHGEQFVDAAGPSQHRELWEMIRREFNTMHGEAVTVTQLRAKYRYLQEQYVKFRAEEEIAAKDPNKLVIYPRCWDMLAEYFGEEGVHNHADVGVDDEEVLVKGATTSQGFIVPGQLEDSQLSAQSTALVPQITSAPPVNSTPLQASQSLVDRQASSPVQTDMVAKRRRLNMSETSIVATDSSIEAARKLEAIQNLQSDMARSMDGMKQVVEQSNEAIRGLQKALDQSNQVNAALLDFLSRQPSA